MTAHAIDQLQLGAQQVSFEVGAIARQASASVYGTTWSQRLWRMTRRLGVRGGSGSNAIADAGSSESGSIVRALSRARGGASGR